MSAGDIKRTLMDVRKMRRAVQMRKETDPEVVSRTLETILKEAIALSTTEDGAMSRAAVKELQQVRRGMLAGQVNAGEKTAQYVGAFSGVLDQVDEAAKQASSEAAEERSEMRSSLAENLPSSDTMISAIMTANPLFGYTLKMGRDFTQTAKRNAEKRRAREKREAEIRKERLEQQENVLKQQMETDEMVRENALEEDQPSSEQNVYQSLLEEIRDEVARLNEVINQGNEQEQVQDDRLERIHETNEDIVSQLEKIHETDRDQMRLERQNQNLSDLRAEEARIEGGGVAAGTTTGPTSQLEQDSDFGFLGSLFRGGTGGLIGSLIAPFASMFGFLKSAGGMLLKFGKFGVVLAVVKGIFDFVDGIFRAGEILGKDEVDWKDRVKVGISNVLSGLLEPINWISETFFGADLMGGKSRDEWTKQYFDFFDNFAENIIGMAKWIGESIMNMFSDIFDSAVQEIKSYLPDWMLEDEEDTIDQEGRDKLNRFRQGGRVPSQLEEEASPESRASRNATSASEQWDAATVVGGSGGGQAPIFAPNSSQTNVNQHQYQGTGSSENREPTHRRFSNLNGILGAGNL